MTIEEGIEFNRLMKENGGRIPRGYKKVNAHWRKCRKTGEKVRVEMHYRKWAV